MISSPIFSQLARDYRPLRILWAGLAVWSISVFSTGISTSFWWACLSRTTTGIGEAAFLCVSPTVINQCAPKKYKSSWIAIFYASIPFGYAIGNICGGIRINSSLFSPQKSWGIIFCLEALAMLPLILSVMVLKGPNTLEDLDTEKLFDPRIKDESTFMSLLKSVFSLCKNRLYVLTTLGYAAQTFTFGGFAYYGIDYSQTALKLNKETASNGMIELQIFFFCDL